MYSREYCALSKSKFRNQSFFSPRSVREPDIVVQMLVDTHTYDLTNFSIGDRFADLRG